MICNASGGTEVLKTIYPLAKWVESPKVPHYYETDSTSSELTQAFEKLSNKYPEGCHGRANGYNMDDCD